MAAWLKARDRLAFRLGPLCGPGRAQLFRAGAAGHPLALGLLGSPDGRLMYSWRLILAPPAVLDYAAAHEVAHLVELNHSPRLLAGRDRNLPRLAAASRLAARAWLDPAPLSLSGLTPAAARCSLGPMLTPRPTDPNAAAHEKLYRSLRQQVMHGELDPGQPLTLRGLAGPMAFG